MATTRTEDTSLGALATSHEVRDRGSTFVAYVYRARTADEARAALVAMRMRMCGLHAHAGEVRHDHADAQAQDTHTRAHRGSGDRGEGERGPYVVGAWRCLVLRPGRTGLSGPDDFVVQDGCEDGGERAAGGRVLGVMQREGVVDAVVAVSRWFGGTLLGPARFAHVETCTSEVCRRFRKMDEMDECVQTLSTLDDLLAALRAELAAAREQAKTQDTSGDADGSRAKRPPDYRAMQDALDLTKAKRLVHARECSIQATKTLIEQCKKGT